MKGEKVVDVIKKVVVQGFPDTFYSLLITNKRVVLIKTGKTYTTAAALAAGAVAGYLAREHAAETYDFSGRDVDALVRRDGANRYIPRHRIEEIRLKKIIGSYWIMIKVLDRDNKKRKFLDGFFMPPRENKQRNLAKGLSAGQIVRLYAEDSQKRILRHLGDKVIRTF